MAADPTVAEGWRAYYGQARYDGTAAVMARLFELDALAPELDAGRAADIMWTVLSVETYEGLVIARGWSADEFEAWVLGTMRASLLRSRPR